MEVLFWLLLYCRVENRDRYMRRCILHYRLKYAVIYCNTALQQVHMIIQYTNNVPTSLFLQFTHPDPPLFPTILITYLSHFPTISLLYSYFIQHTFNIPRSYLHFPTTHLPFPYSIFFPYLSLHLPTFIPTIYPYFHPYNS